ncbi:kinesin-like protein Klp10A isoform X1 [Macrosteles quadrilineatus]|uniref:kinesin-like protein Klp10A isoform X1 n=1 Tax=Macrosteles quadrilineatus TaxID=74068 RepID=UPI0023E0A695|nr:kinesin-like protein Klp10A isoform X1 [Macrosteles quadrilineatus]
MDEDFSAIKSGISVDIKRTDGRVHPAVVSGVNQATRCVTVEWFEHGETKGKEIEIEAILALNLHLAAGNYNNQNAVPNNQGYPLARGSSEEEEEETSDVEDEGTAQRQPSTATLPIRTTLPSRPYSTKASIPIVNNKGSYRSNKVQSRPTTINSNSVNGHLASEVQSVPPTPTIPVATATRFTNNMAPNNTAANNAANNAAAAAAARKATSRQSNVVKEVEKLKKNREERRQRQAELKEEKEALMNIDPGNPNWEFLGMIRNYRANIDFRPIKDTDPVEDHQITVCVRKRPLNKKEVVRKEVDVISVPSRDQIIVHEPRNKVDLTKYLENQHFRFDYAFDDTCSNEIVYKFTAKPLVQTIFDGGMATCFAYGQTGSGKTHTMGGDFNGKTQDCKKGIYAMAAKDVFKFLKSPQYKPLNLVVSASFFEIYSGKVFDLLADKSKLRVLEDGNNVVQIVGLTEKIVDSVEEVLKLIQHGNTVRTSGQTSANSNSSRSHAVFQILLRPPGMNRIHGKFSLIDLAGNERGADTSSANRQTRMEGAEINKSLLALKECIRALGRKGAHLPFRVSKLTQVLRDSFIGDKSKTCMIAMISPGLSSCEHSLNTLRYADRVKELAASDPTEPKSNSSPDDEQPQRPRHNNSGGSEVFDDDDLATLRSLNEGEISAEMMTFHEAVSQLQLLEEDVLETHKGVLDCHASWQQRHAQLLNMARDVDYDQDAYSKQLRNLLVEEIEVLKQILEKNDQFRVQLVNEEQISQKMKHPQHLGYN